MCRNPHKNRANLLPMCKSCSPKIPTAVGKVQQVIRPPFSARKVWRAETWTGRRQNLEHPKPLRHVHSFRWSGKVRSSLLLLPLEILLMPGPQWQTNRNVNVNFMAPQIKSFAATISTNERKGKHLNK